MRMYIQETLSMTKILILSITLAFVLTAHAVTAQEALAEKTIPWGVSEDRYLNANEFNTGTVSGKVHNYDAKKSTKINNADFTKTVKFIDKKGLSQISYVAKPNEKEFENTCAMIQSSVNKLYGQRTNEVHIFDQGPNNYTEVIWTSKLDRIVRVFCFSAQNSNIVSVSLFPRWMVLDCTMHADETTHKAKDRRAFFYFDNANEEIRFFNNSEVSLPFTSTFSDARIAFTHNNKGDNTTIDLNTGVIMSKFIDNKGHEELLIGRCKKQ